MDKQIVKEQKVVGNRNLWTKKKDLAMWLAPPQQIFVYCLSISIDATYPILIFLFLFCLLNFNFKFPIKLFLWDSFLVVNNYQIISCVNSQSSTNSFFIMIAFILLKMLAFLLIIILHLLLEILPRINLWLLDFY